MNGERTCSVIKFYPLEKIVLNRVHLRMIEDKDAGGILAIRSNLDMIRYTGIPQMQNMDQAKDFVTSRLDGMKDNKWIYLVIAHKETDELMGTACIFNFNDSKTSADLGYELLPAYQGNGYVHEALMGLMAFAYEHLKLTHLTADIHEENLPSINVVKRAGFEFTKELEGGYKLFSASSANGLLST